jgi:5,6-dimethylbenzimidazole synthase
MTTERFSDVDRAALYRIIDSRRDVRAFRRDPVEDETLRRILLAAHHAPSVGLMQPWNFIVVRDPAVKARVKAVFLQENERGRSGPHGLGRNSVVDTDVYSTCCAVQNLWLAARAEGVGVGWVSIVDNEALRAILNIPAGVLPVAYLCLGYPREFLDEPELQRRGWAHRLSLDDLVFENRWPHVPGELAS